MNIYSVETENAGLSCIWFNTGHQRWPEQQPLRMKLPGFCSGDCLSFFYSVLFHIVLCKRAQVVELRVVLSMCSYVICYHLVCQKTENRAKFSTKGKNSRILLKVNVCRHKTVLFLKSRAFHGGFALFWWICTLSGQINKFKGFFKNRQTKLSISLMLAAIVQR